MKIVLFRYVLIGVISLLFSGNCHAENPSGSGRDSLGRSFLGKESAQRELSKIINQTHVDFIKGKVLIKDKEMLISIVEPVLFQVFGKENILKEKPYEAYLFGDYWLIRGTMPATPPTVLLSNGARLETKIVGGTFSVAINRKTCEIIGITHGE